MARFKPDNCTPLPFTNPSSIASADFNGDSKLDMLIGFPNTAVIAAGNGDGTPVRISVPPDCLHHAEFRGRWSNGCQNADSIWMVA